MKKDRDPFDLIMVLFLTVPIVLMALVWMVLILKDGLV